MTSRERISHSVERGPEPTDFRSGLPYRSSYSVVAGTPFGGDLEKVVNRLLKELASADNRSKCRGQQTKKDQSHAPYCGAINRCERFSLRLAGAQKKITRRQGWRNISEDACDTIDTHRLFP